MENTATYSTTDWYLIAIYPLLLSLTLWKELHFFIYDGHCYLLRFIEAVVDSESRGFHSFYYIEHYQMQYMFNKNICSIRMFEYYVKKKKKPLPIVSRPSGPSLVKPKKVSFGPIGTECAGSGRRPRGGRRPTGEGL